MDSLSDSDKHRFVLAPLFPSSVHVHLYVHCSCVFICALFMYIRMCPFPSVALHTCAHVCSPEHVEAQGWCWAPSYVPFLLRSWRRDLSVNLEAGLTSQLVLGTLSQAG